MRPIIEELIHNSVYRSTLQLIAERTDMYVDNRTSSTILNIALIDVKCSSLNEADFYYHLKENNTGLIAYCIARVKAFKGDRSVQDYQDGEEQENDDELVKQGGLAAISLIGFIIEFHYLLNKDDEGLSQYLKKIRMPQAAKHKSSLERLFKSTY